MQKEGGVQSPDDDLTSRAIPPPPGVDARVYDAIGRDFLGHFTKLGGLEPNERVGDVMCGFGRMAVQLARYLTPRGRYFGFDTRERAIRWCEENIGERHPHFRFRHAPLRNAFWSPGGDVAASEFSFPYPDAWFNFVIVTAVMPHLTPPDMERFLSETTRVLVPGGRAFLTYFVIDDTALANLEAGKATREFVHRYDDVSWVMNAEMPEATIAFEQNYLLKALRNFGLRVSQPISYGSWSGRDDFVSYQDIVIASRPKSRRTRLSKAFQRGAH